MNDGSYHISRQPGKTGWGGWDCKGHADPQEKPLGGFGPRYWCRRFDSFILYYTQWRRNSWQKCQCENWNLVLTLFAVRKGASVQGENPCDSKAVDVFHSDYRASWLLVWNGVSWKDLGLRTLNKQCYFIFLTMSYRRYVGWRYFGSLERQQPAVSHLQDFFIKQKKRLWKI